MLDRLDGLRWRRCDFGTCVEVAQDGPAVYIRDSKDRHGGLVRIPVPAWTAFIEALRDGEFETPYDEDLEAEAA